VTLLCYTVPLFEHNAHTSLDVLHALLQTQTEKNPEQDRKKRDRQESSPPTLEKPELSKSRRLYL
jgi:hypothetical protein